MPHDPWDLRLVMQRASPADVPLTFRAMFGGIMACAGGKRFAPFSDVGLALKLFGRDHADLLRPEGGVALRYAPDQPISKSYVLDPDFLLRDPDGLRSWVGRCVAHLAQSMSQAPRSRIGVGRGSASTLR